MSSSSSLEVQTAMASVIAHLFYCILVTLEWDQPLHYIRPTWQLPTFCVAGIDAESRHAVLCLVNEARAASLNTSVQRYHQGQCHIFCAVVRHHHQCQYSHVMPAMCLAGKIAEPWSGV